jgi:hypothetical protein
MGDILQREVPKLLFGDMKIIILRNLNNFQMNYSKSQLSHGVLIRTNMQLVE